MNKFKMLFRILKFTLPFLILSGFCISCGYAQDAPVISMDFKDADFKDVLKAFSIQSGINFIASQEIEDRTVTLYLDKVSVKDAMDMLFKANKLDYEFAEEAKIMFIKKAEPELKTIAKIFPLKYHSVPSSNIKKEIESNLGGTGGDILTSIEGVLSGDGKITEDARSNSLIITDIPSRFPLIEQILVQLDQPTPQVMLEVEILDVSKNLVDDLGFNFGESPFTWILPGSWRGARFFMGDLTKKGARIDDAGVAGSVIFGNTYAALLDFLRTQTDTKYLARPRVLTLNNETAEIKITTQEAVGEKKSVSGETGSQTTTTEAERYETGVSLRVTPQINLETDEITMFIMPIVADASLGSVVSSTGVAFWNTEERITKSVVRVRDGETVVLGGLIRNELSQAITKLPILGDIPILGALFRHKDKSKDLERELLVFITPHIVKDAFWPQAKDASAMLSSREQDIPSKKARLLSIEATLNSFNANRY